MTFLDQLNLRPQEKRILVGVGFLVFVVLNWMFVRPLFGQWAAGQKDLDAARNTQTKYQTEIAKAPTYKALEENLRKAGNEVLNEELQLQRVVVEQYAAAAGIIPTRINSAARPTGGKTNQFFEDQTLTVDFSTFSTNFVEWLVGLATGDNMIRVQEMNLKPDANLQRLSGSILFVASYQKKAPARAAATTTPRPAAAITTTNATGVKPSLAGSSAPRTTNSPAASRAATNSPVKKPLTTSKPSAKPVNE